MKLTNELLNKLQENYQTNNSNSLIQNSVIKNGIRNTVFDNATKAKHNYVFNVETKKGNITSQKNSGRCWIFASLNMARVRAMEKLNVKEFEFSQNYLAFYDKLEKANSFLNNMSNHLDKPLNDRLVHSFITHPAPDGGYYEWFNGLIKKYGAVPKSIMEETFHSGNTTEMNHLISLELLKAVKAMRNNPKDVQAIKEQALTSVYDIVAKCLGVPPKSFSYEYHDKDDKYQKIANITPSEFFNQYVGSEFNDKVDIIHDPRNIYPLGAKYTLKYQKSVYEDQEVKMINVDLKDIKTAIINSLKDGNVVWFGCDVDPFKDNATGIMDVNLYQYDNAFNLQERLTKVDRINFYNSTLTHAMAFVGVNLDEQGNPITWKVENSWGKDCGKDGIFSMSDQWFDEYNFSAIVDAKYLDNKYLDESNPVVLLEPWDPLA